MAWSTSDRRSELPPDWDKIRKRILKRDNGACQWREYDGSICLSPANQVDHRYHADSHEDWNLQSLCEWHHNKKSAREGNAAKAARRNEIRSRFRRPSQALGHPGII